MATHWTTRELIADCLSRIESDDACASFDLASLFMSHADSKEVGLYLAVVEALARRLTWEGHEFLDKIRETHGDNDGFLQHTAFSQCDT